MPAMAAWPGVDAPAAAAWAEPDVDRFDDSTPPRIDSPPIAADWPGGQDRPLRGEVIDAGDTDGRTEAPEQRSIRRRASDEPRLAFPRSFVGLRTSVTAMGALMAALLIWRADVVRLLPQTATFYRTIGLDVNLRGLAFKDVRLTSEAVEGKPVLVIEGVIVDETRKAVEVPRLRFVVRDVKGTEIYAWNAVLEQASLKPGEKAWFRSRLAAPPAEAHSVDVRFFHKRDLAAGAA